MFRLQSYGFDRSKYERPPQKWVCGWAAEGKACHLGPDGKGRCVASYECVPIRKGDRWQCTRSREFGGVCSAGPLPEGTCCNPIPRCQPVLSTRAKRGALARWASLFVLGAALVFLSGPSMPDFISPGGLTSPHQTASDSCGNCHSSFEGGPAEWMRVALSSGEARDDSKLCLACHILGENSASPHGVPESRLSASTRRIREKNTVAPVSAEKTFSNMLLGSGEATGRGAVRCAACHQEHRGRRADLTAMNTRRCQSCHAAPFADFSESHPEFSSFPFKRRTRLIFDHVSHLNKHFMGDAKEKAPKSCNSCHALDSTGATMKVLSFEKTCAGCHEAQIMGEGSAGAKGVPFIVLPGLDAESLKEAGIDVGEWPRDAEAEGLDPFLSLLLSADPGFGEIKATLKDVDLLDLSSADAKKKSAAGRLAWAIKGLVHGLALKGQQELRARLDKIFADRLSDSEFSALSAQLPVGVVRAAGKAWFPGLAKEMARKESGGKSEDKEKEDKPEAEEAEEMPSAEEVSIAGGWYVQDFSLYYRPSGHGDSFLRSWLELGGMEKGSAQRGVFAALSAPKAIGFCGKCHSADLSGDGGRRMNWKARGPKERVKTFVRYKHAPHFSLLDEKGCLTCHKLKSDSKFMDSFKGADPAVFSSNFQGIPKAVCAACHTQGGASDNCLTCHDYHIGKVMPALTNAPMRIQDISGKGK